MVMRLGGAERYAAILAKLHPAFV